MTAKFAKFDEPIFYHNGDYSAFLDGGQISTEGIKLAKSSDIPSKQTLLIEFSFPQSSFVVKTKASLDQSKGTNFVKFLNLDKKSKEIIKQYVSSRSGARSISAVEI